MKKDKCCFRCWDMTTPTKKNSKICSKCRKSYKYSKKEMEELKQKGKEALKYLNSHPITKSTIGDTEAYGGSDF